MRRFQSWPARFKGACGAAVSTCVVGACALGPHYRQPSIDSPAAWQEGVQREDESTPLSKTSLWPDPAWWHGFNSTRLNELVAEAEHNNDDLAGAMARVLEADAQVRIAGAPLFPNIDLGADGTRERSTVTGEGPHPFNIYNPEFTASYELDFWGKNRAARDAARAAATASRYDRQTVALTVVSSVAGTYFQILEYRDRIRVAEQNLENGRRVLRGLQLEQSAGIATGLDVAQQDTTVALLDAAVPPLNQQLRQSVHALAILLGKTPESIDIAEGTLTDLASPVVIEGLPSQLLSRRPDIAEAEQQLVSANADIRAARAALFPSIVLTTSGGYESTALSTLFDPINRMYTLSAGLTQPIFRGGALRGQVAYNRARYEELLSSYHKTVLTAFGNVEDALTAARQTRAQQERQRDAVAKARRAFEFAQAQMKAGIVNVLTVLNTENALFGAEDSLVQVHYAHLRSLIDLYTALGGGWQQG